MKQKIICVLGFLTGLALCTIPILDQAMQIDMEQSRYTELAQQVVQTTNTPSVTIAPTVKTASPNIIVS